MCPSSDPSRLPPIRSLADVEAIERTPLETRLGPGATLDMIRHSAAAWPDSPALSFVMGSDAKSADAHWTYAELLADITRTANLFKAFGLAAGDRIGIVMPNLPETHMAIWGGEAAGVACLVNPLLEPDQITAILAAADVRLIVTLGPAPKSDLWKKMVAAIDSLPKVRAVLTVDPLRYLGGLKRMSARMITGRSATPRGDCHVEDFHQALDRMSGEKLSADRRVAPETVAALFHTGGTTGVPKLARHTHANQRYMAWVLSQVAGMSGADTVLCGLPLFHVNAAIVTGLAPFSIGAHVVLAGPQGYRTPGLVENFWSLVERFGVSTFSGVPTLYASLLQHPVGKHDISSLRFAICGAAPMPPETFKRFEDRTGIPILEGYGLTEGTCATATNPMHGVRNIGSVGLRLPYQQVRIARLDEAGNPTGAADTDETGALLIKGPNVFPGYLDPAANRGVLLDGGWLNTGDLARQDAQGYLWLSGRAKDIIIRGGHNIDPQVIEDALARHPAVALAAAVGQPDAYAGEVPAAFVTLHAGADDTATAEDLMAHARDTIPERAAVPVHIDILDQMPMTAVGKTFKPPLRARAAERALAQALSKKAIEATITAEVTKDGLVADVVPVLAGDAPEIRRTLSAFALTVKVREPAAQG